MFGNDAMWFLFSNGWKIKWAKWQYLGTIFDILRDVIAEQFHSRDSSENLTFAKKSLNIKLKLKFYYFFSSQLIKIA